MSGNAMFTPQIPVPEALLKAINDRNVPVLISELEKVKAQFGPAQFARMTIPVVQPDGSRLDMRIAPLLDNAYRVQARLDAEKSQNASPKNEGNAMTQPADSTPTGEVTGLVSAQQQAGTWAEQFAGVTAQLETFAAYLSGEDVTDDDVHGGIAEAQEAATTAAAAMARCEAALQRHNAVKEAYAANEGAGNKTFNLSE